MDKISVSFAVTNTSTSVRFRWYDGIVMGVVDNTRVIVSFDDGETATVRLHPGNNQRGGGAPTKAGQWCQKPPGAAESQVSTDDEGPSEVCVSK